MYMILLPRPLLDNTHRSKGPWFVVGKDLDANILYITNHYDSLQTESRRAFEVQNLNWISGSLPPQLQDGQEATLDVSVTVLVPHGPWCFRLAIYLLGVVALPLAWYGFVVG